MAPHGEDAARAEVLARIRAALGTGENDPAGGAGAGVPRGYRARAGLGTAALISLLIDRLRDYGTAVRRCPAGGEAQAVRAALAERGARRVVLPPGLGLDGAAPDGVTFLADDSLPPDALDAADGVITTAAVAIAETGTIILDGGPGQGRRVLSLVPDYHLCLLKAGQVVGIVPEALGRLDPGRPCTWISGPSATSDIELDRVQGVHGPRALEVILAGP
jgi:L-lactate dehydrogenase complex protein LldG